jgi:methylmalonyl-CoA mutase
MLADKFSIADDFPAVSYEEWRAAVAVDLKGAPFDKKLITHTYDGIDIQPLYTRRDRPVESDSHGYPGLPPFVRGSRPLGAVPANWDLRQEFSQADLATANRAMVEDVNGGVTSLLIRLDAAAASGFDPDDAAAGQLAARGGLMIYSVEDLAEAVSGIPLERISVSLEAGAAFLPAAALLVACWERRGLGVSEARGAFNADPWAALASSGRLPMSASDAKRMLADLAVWTAKNAPQVSSVGVDTSVYHEAGATSAQDIAFGVATGVEYLRAMTERGMTIDAAARQFLFRISLGTHHFLAIAKLRGARKLWSRVVEASGGAPKAGGMRIHARLSARVLTERDPYVNILRNTVAVFAAGVAGAEAITSEPFDSIAGEPSEFARRLARNTALILQEEGNLHRVIDPAGGSWFLDSLTDELAAESWKIFQEIERRGGMLAALQSGWIGQEIESAFAPRAANIARRREGITGVSEFPNLQEERLVRSTPDMAALAAVAKVHVVKSRKQDAMPPGGFPELEMTVAAIRAAKQGATIGQLAAAAGIHKSVIEIESLAPRSFAAPFEELRAAVDAWTARNGVAPRVFLVSMGSVADHTARTTYAKNFFEAGGFDVVAAGSFRDAAAAGKAFAEGGANVAVICSSDQLYPELVPSLAGQLKTAGARTVVLAGAPGANEAAWRAAGVDRFIFMKCDVASTLREILREEGVLSS